MLATAGVCRCWDQSGRFVLNHHYGLVSVWRGVAYHRLWLWRKAARAVTFLNGVGKPARRTSFTRDYATQLATHLRSLTMATEVALDTTIVGPFLFRRPDRADQARAPLW